MRNINWHANAWAEYTLLQSDKTVLRKLNQLIKEIQRNGYESSLGKLEMLRGNYSGFASVRIDKKNRLIFQVTDTEVNIVKCGGHYEDK